MFVPFQLANPKKKFFFRFESTLFYKEQLISPFGDISLFNKMERIKVSFLILRSFVRTENLNHLKMKLFALNNSFESRGELESTIDKREPDKEKYKGGIDGKNLISKWSKYFLWKTNFKVLRNYLGEGVTFQIFFKTYLVLYFIFLCPFSIAAEFIKTFVI